MRPTGATGAPGAAKAYPAGARTRPGQHLQALEPSSPHLQSTTRPCRHPLPGKVEIPTRAHTRRRRRSAATRYMQDRSPLLGIERSPAFQFLHGSHFHVDFTKLQRPRVACRLSSSKGGKLRGIPIGAKRAKRRMTRGDGRPGRHLPPGARRAATTRTPHRPWASTNDHLRTRAPSGRAMHGRLHDNRAAESQGRPALYGGTRRPARPPAGPSAGRRLSACRRSPRHRAPAKGSWHRRPARA